MKKFPVFKEFGANAVLITWENKIDPLVNNQVIVAEKYIEQRFKEVVLETVPAYNELAIYLKKKITPSLFITILKKNLKTLSLEDQAVAKKIITIPVCYDAVFGLDLERVAKMNKLSKTEVIKIHSATEYKVYFLGFLPGFPYLGGLDERLSTPRLNTPRKRVERGTVAIGGSQTGIYPSDSPGGWNIIGRTPLHLFDIMSDPKFLLKAGDFIKFKPISKEEFERNKPKFKNKIHIIEKEGWHYD